MGCTQHKQVVLALALTLALRLGGALGCTQRKQVALAPALALALRLGGALGCTQSKQVALTLALTLTLRLGGALGCTNHQQVANPADKLLLATTSVVTTEKPDGSRLLLIRIANVRMRSAALDVDYKLWVCPYYRFP